MKVQEINQTINRFSYVLKLHFYAIMIIAYPASSFAQHQPGNIQLQFQHTVGNHMLHLDSSYRNNFGEQFTVTKFKYYISNIAFSDTIRRTQYFLKDLYFLVNEADPESKLISVQIPSGTYHNISFLVGIDSSKNISGAQTGALDPLNDMFWTWRSGYVMVKLEGRSPASALQRRMFEYHIGGFSGNHNVLARVSLTLPKTADIAHGKSLQIHVQANLNAWFDGAHALSITQHPACTSPGSLAKQFSENYMQMFTIQSVQVE